jgi:hypothetical protein
VLRKIAFGLMALAVLWFGGRVLVHALASNETLIRWKLEDACEGFNDARMSPILDFIARDFLDQSSGAHRDDVRAGAAAAFFTEKDPKTRAFPLRAHVVPDTLAITIDEADKKQAQMRCTIRIVDTSGGGERVVWEFRLNGRLFDGDDGWQLVESRREDDKGDFRMH